MQQLGHEHHDDARHEGEDQGGCTDHRDAECGQASLARRGIGKRSARHLTEHAGKPPTESAMPMLCCDQLRFAR